MLGTCVTFGGLQASSHPQVPTTLHNLEHFFTLSHTLPLHDSHLNIGILIAKIQENLARNKANKMVDKIQPYNLVSLVVLNMLHSSFNAASLFVTEETEADALLNWKASLQNETQSHLTSWTLLHNATNSSSNQNTSSIPCSWFDITCNQAGSVISLDLTNSGLKGTLHEFSFLSLPNLAYVCLNINELFGTIPIEISGLSKLIYPDTSFNKLSGEIPPQIRLLTNL